MGTSASVLQAFCKHSDGKSAPHRFQRSAAHFNPCNGEGRGFESLHPLQESSTFSSKKGP
jgi:hypothetical protein